MSAQTVIEVANLKVELGQTTILHNISVQIPQGKITVVIGPSGSGKTTLLKSLVRFHKYQGTVTLNGQDDIQHLEIRDLRKQLVYVHQIPVIFPATISDNIGWGRKMWHIPNDEDRVRYYLDLVGLRELDPKQLAKNLSVGQQQRIHLARSLAIEPKVLLLDEPASALDAIAKEAFENLLQKMLEEVPELSIVLITHDLNQARRIADYGVLLHQGEMLLQGTADSFFQKMEQLSEAELLKQLIGGKEN